MPLTPFEGLPVTRTTVKVTNAGDGLSQAMKVDPAELHQGDRVYLVLECEVAKVTHEPVDREDPRGPQARVHTLRAGRATLVDADLVRGVLDEQDERIEAAAGIERLDFGVPDDLSALDDGAA